MVAKEYEIMVAAVRDDNDTLTVKNRELKRESLELLAERADLEVLINTLQNEVRVLKSENGSLDDKLERKRMGIKSLEKDCSALRDQLASCNVVISKHKAEHS